jgi:hypothetical protein
VEHLVNSGSDPDVQIFGFRFGCHENFLAWVALLHNSDTLCNIFSKIFFRQEKAPWIRRGLKRI